jgi:hypothetical protein
MMIRTIFLALTATMIVAQPTSAQTVWRTETGRFTATLPPQIQPKAPWGNKRDEGAFDVGPRKDANGFCSFFITRSGMRTSHFLWTNVVTKYAGDGEARARADSRTGGNAFVSYGGRRDLISRAGWAGYFIWFEQIDQKSGSNQTVINASTMLTDEDKLTFTCRSLPGKRLTAKEIDAAYLLARSFEKL